MKKGILVSYMLLLGLVIGIEVSVGVLVAPVIFFPAPLIGEGVLSHFQSGLMMTQIFLRFDAILFIITMFGFFYEVVVFVQKKDILAFVLAALVVLFAAAFIFYYTPAVIEMQKLGEAITQSSDFASIHKQSEICLKALMVVQIALFFRRFFKTKEYSWA